MNEKKIGKNEKINIKKLKLKTKLKLNVREDNLF